MEATQCDLILEALQHAKGDWVAMPYLAEVSGSMNIHTRVDELRHERHLNIENRLEAIRGTHRRKSFYRLVIPKPADAEASNTPA